jgi:hypothetical protein
LDKDARIIGKKLDEHQLEYFVESLLFDKGIIKTKPSLPKEPAPKKHDDDDSHSNDTGSNDNSTGSNAEADKPNNAATKTNQ